jgi:glycosyltransferase involved in cell wall biosynthesis
MLCAGLPSAGIDASVVSVYDSGLDGGGRSELGVPVVDLGRRGRGDYAYFPALVATLRRLKPDVVHAHLHTGQYPGRIAALLAAVPSIVLTIHGREPGGPVRWALDRVLHARTARFIVFTDAQRRRFASEQHVPAERIAIIPNGAQPQPAAASRAELRVALGIPGDAFAVYAIGRLSEEKNHAALLDAVATLGAGAPELHLVLAGSGPLESDLRERARARGIVTRVHFLGYRPDATRLCAAMDLFALTSFREAMPLALGEAMLGGLAPLITPWRDHDAFVRDGENGYVTADCGAAAISATLERARSDAGRGVLAARAGETARALFDPAAMVAAHAALYRALVAA